MVWLENVGRFYFSGSRERQSHSACRARPLVTKLQLGHALVLEALLPPACMRKERARHSTPTKQSFGDKCVPKLERLCEKSGELRKQTKSDHRNTLVKNKNGLYAILVRPNFEARTFHTVSEFGNEAEGA